MKRLLLFVFMSALAIAASAQAKCNIKKAYAFYTVSVPGMQMVDENGNPIPPKADINRLIYIEWSGAKKPEIESVLYNDKPLAATITPVENSSVVPGGEIGNNSDFKITAKKCNSLWKIELQTPVAGSVPAQGGKNIIIKTKGSENSCEFRLTKETELMALPRY